MASRATHPHPLSYEHSLSAQARQKVPTSWAVHALPPKLRVGGGHQLPSQPALFVNAACRDWAGGACKKHRLARQLMPCPQNSEARSSGVGHGLPFCKCHWPGSLQVVFTKSAGQLGSWRPTPRASELQQQGVACSAGGLHRTWGGGGALLPTLQQCSYSWGVGMSTPAHRWHPHPGTEHPHYAIIWIRIWGSFLLLKTSTKHLLESFCAS